MQKHFLLVIILISAFACNNIKTNTKANQVTETVKVKPDYSKSVEIKIIDGDSLIVCNYYAVGGETFNLSLSNFVDSCYMVKLEKKRKALVKPIFTNVSEHYIGVMSSGKEAYKLFDKYGNYLYNIGEVGKGPNEYLSIYDGQIDEPNNRIYLLPWMTNKLLAYDLNGEALSNIPLLKSFSKAKFYLKHDTITCFNLPFSGNDPLVWQQTMGGELINCINADHRSLHPDFSNEVFSFESFGDFSFNLFKFFGPFNDSLYQYKTGKIIPVFTTNFGRAEHQIPIHHYFEIPGYYGLVIESVKEQRGNSKISSIDEIIVVNKITHQANKVKLVNDFLGGIEMNISNTFKNGMFIQNMYAIELIDKIDMALQDEANHSIEEKAKLTALKNSLDENDNNVVFYGKLKSIFQ